MAKLQHPSNRLYRGECTSFEDAMSTVRGQCMFEKSPYIADPNDAKLNESLDKMSAATRIAEAIYAKHVSAARAAAIAEMRASTDEDIRNFGECLQSGDYSPLAI